MKKTITGLLALLLFSTAMSQEVIVEDGNLRLNDSTLLFRSVADFDHGLGWYGTAKTFSGVEVEGPVLFGNGGGLGLRNGGVESLALRWNSDGDVGIGINNPLARLMVFGPAGTPLLSGTASNGLVRLLGSGAAGYLDIGKQASSPFIGWIQAGFNATADPLALQPLGGNLGVGTAAPTHRLDVDGVIRMRTGAVQGYIPVGDSNGVMTWTDPNLLSVPETDGPVPIRFQGQILHVHPTDNGTNVEWGIEAVTGATSQTDGSSNTNAIISSGAGGATAAGICDTLTAFGFDDWYLPAQYEMDAVYKQSYLLSDLQLNADWKYWSSTEIDSLNAWAHRLDYGGPDEDGKVEVNHNVRCVRND